MLTSEMETAVESLLRVLVVEVSCDGTSLIQRELNSQFQMRTEVTVADSLPTALRLLSNQCYDALVLDSRALDLSDPVCTRRLRAVSAQLPVVAVGDDGAGSAVFILRSGAQDYLNRQESMGPQLTRSIRFSIERHRVAVELDEQTRRLRESELSTRVIIQASADAMIIVDRIGQVRFVNPAAETMFGRPCCDLLGSSFGFPLGVGQATELDILHKDGSIGVAEMRVVEVTWDGESAFLASLRDITERKRIQGEIEAANSRLEQRVQERTAALEGANRELEAFAFSVSHDLTAPLRHIRGFAEILAEQVDNALDDEARGLFKRIFDSSERMQALIRGLLEFSRLGRAAMSIKRIDLRRLVEGVIDELSHDLVDRKVEWCVGELPEVQADFILLRQVFVNLIANALKFTRGRTMARIEIVSLQRAGETIVAVRDNGVGFDMRWADKLFNVFQRLHNSNEYEGTGIGLANVQRIIQRHGGRVWVEAVPDQGAAFYFTLGRE